MFTCNPTPACPTFHHPCAAPQAWCTATSSPPTSCSKRPARTAGGSQSRCEGREGPGRGGAGCKQLLQLLNVGQRRVLRTRVTSYMLGRAACTQVADIDLASSFPVVHLLGRARLALPRTHHRHVRNRRALPINLLLLPCAVRQVGDFGLAHLVGANTSLQSNTWGSIAYMAPVGAKGRGGKELSVMLNVIKGWRRGKLYWLAGRVVGFESLPATPSCPCRTFAGTELASHPLCVPYLGPHRRRSGARSATPQVRVGTEGLPCLCTCVGPLPPGMHRYRQPKSAVRCHSWLQYVRKTARSTVSLSAS